MPWPARVPNQVLTSETYDIVMDTTRPIGDRLAAFTNREAWLRTLGTAGYTTTINKMISNFGDMGVVEVRPGPAGSPHFPPLMEVEQLAPPQAAPLEVTAEIRASGLAPEPDLPPEEDELEHIEKVRRFPHGLRS